MRTASKRIVLILGVCVLLGAAAHGDPPVAQCKNATVQLDQTGAGFIVPDDVDDESYDPDGTIEWRGVVPSTFDCSDLGDNTVILTVRDNEGLEDTCEANVIVEDNRPPTAVCKDITVELDENGEATIIADDIDNGSHDNQPITEVCGIASLEIDIETFGCDDVDNPVMVTLTVTDVGGNVDTCQATVTVEENTDPVALCKDTTVELDENGEAIITADDIDNGSYDNCSIAVRTPTPASFDCEDLGDNAVLFTVLDPSDNWDSCPATVTVEDNMDPTAVCQDITVYVDEFGSVTITADDVNDESSDNCGIDSLEIDRDTFTCDDVGDTIPVTLTVYDASGNSNFCTANVTVEDDIPPTAVCQDIAVQIDATGNPVTITAEDIDDGSDDNCGVDSLEIDIDTFTCDDVGPNTVTLTVTDTSDNTAQCQATVTVEDNFPPTAKCKDITVYVDATGSVTITGDDVDDDSTDNCGIDSMTVDPDGFTCDDVGNTIPVTLTVYDAASNSDFCTANVTVEDNIPPTAVCQNITRYLDSEGTLTITADDVDNGSFDNCDIDSLELDKYTFTCEDRGLNDVTLTVTDTSDNTDTCQATVAVVDDEDPVARCKNITVELDENGEATITGEDVDNDSTDNCDIALLEVEPDSFTWDDLGENFVTLTVMDTSARTDSCQATVTVEDNIPPTAEISLMDPNPTNLDAVRFSVAFSESVGGTFTDFDVSVIGALSGNPAVTGANPDYVVTVTMSDPDADGTVGISIGTFVTDVAGNDYAGGTSGLYTINNGFVFTTHPQDAKRYSGESHTFAVAGEHGSGTPSYQWKWDDAGGGGTVPGSKTIHDVGNDSPTYGIPNVTGKAGGYWCEVTYNLVKSCSNTATLSVKDHLNITQQPQGADKVTGESHTFAVAATGGYSPLGYAWKQGTTEVGHNWFYMIESLQVSDSGSYTVEVSDANSDVVVSDAAVLNVSKALPVAGLAGLGILLGACAVAGALAAHRRK